MELIIKKAFDGVISYYMNNNSLSDIHYHKSNNDKSAVGDIILGKVKNIVKNINAAFIDIGEEELCFLQMNENDDLKREQEVMVQIKLPEVKTKNKVVTRKFEICGRYLILTSKLYISVSKKIKNVILRNELKELVEDENPICGFIIRTNAENVPKEEILAEKEKLIALYKDILKRSETSTVFSTLYKSDKPYLSALSDIYIDEDISIITDDEKIYEELKAYTNMWLPDLKDKIKSYDKSSLSLNAVYGLPTKFKKALMKKVWLDSGAYLVIEPTEAMVVIDVNTGKAIKSNKSKEEMVFKINMEAADEIMKQVRLRNLSGIIIIDFIDMSDEEHKDALMEKLRILAAKDSTRTTVLDITKLGLVEMTRMKKDQPLHEKFAISGDEIIVIDR